MSSDASPPPSRTSLLAQAPKFAPPASPSKSASPARQPLQDRSGAHTNRYSGPTIRIVGDSEDDVYLKFPTPSEPSQILPPPRHAPGYGFERPGSRVSSGSQVANTVAKFEAGRAPVPQPPSHGFHQKRKFRQSASTRTSDADTLVASSFSPSTVRLSQGTTPPSSPPPEFADFEKGLEQLQGEAPSRSQRPTIRAVSPSSSGGESLESRTHALTPKASFASPASTISAAPPALVSNAGNASVIRDTQSSSNTHKHSSFVESEAGQLPPAAPANHRQPTLRPSIESFAYSDISYTSIEPSFPQSVPTIHEARTATVTSGLRVNHPIVRTPSASSFRAGSQNAPTITSRMQDRSLAHQWSSQLSTIASVSERDSRSLARRSRSYGARSHSEDSLVGNGRAQLTRRRGQTVGSLQSSSDEVSSEGHTEYSAMPRPLFSPVSRASSTERDYHGEHLDTISPLPSTIPLRTKNSGYLRRQNSDAGSARSIPDSRPGSAQSDLSTFIHNTIPAWARVYYRRGERISMAPSESESASSHRLGTSHSGRSHTPSESYHPFGVYRPRNRPRNRGSQADSVSLADEMRQIDGNIYILGSDRRPLSGWSTPHLGHDQRGRMLYSAWQAPSLDDNLNASLFGRQNRQILLFCLGFIFPFGRLFFSAPQLRV